MPEPRGLVRAMDVLSPLTGTVVPLDEVPDPVFAGRMVGEGVAILPAEGAVVAPFAGWVKALFPTGHALGVASDEGVEVLIHLGIDSARCAGLFVPRVQPGDRVDTGQVLVVFDPGELARRARSALSPVVVTLQAGPVRVTVRARGQVCAGRDVLLRVDPA